MLLRAKRFAAAGLAVLLMAMSAHAGAPSPLLAGTSKVEITPPVPYPFRPAGELTGLTVLDPLYARLLAMRVGEVGFVLIAVDLTLPFGPEQIRWLRSEVKSRTGIAHMLLAATHNHAGPTIRRSYAGDAVPAWERAVLEKIAVAAVEAERRMAPVRLGVGWGLSYLGFNRLSRDPYASGFQLDRTRPGAGDHPTDPTVGVIRIDKLNGRPLAVVVNYACHPVILGPGNRSFSAEFPGVMAATVEERWAEESTLCLFLQGGAGNINPHRSGLGPDENAVEEMRRVGRSLGEEVLRTCDQVVTRQPDKPGINIRERELHFENRWTTEAIEAAAREGRLLVDRFWLPALGRPIATSMTTVLINDEVALVALPGEPFVEFQLELRRRSPLQATFLAGYTNDYVGYLPTIEAAAAGGFGANTLETIVEVGAGQKMINLALIDIYSLLGRLSPYPAEGRGDDPARPLKSPFQLHYNGER